MVAEVITLRCSHCKKHKPREGFAPGMRTAPYPRCRGCTSVMHVESKKRVANGTARPRRSRALVPMGGKLDMEQVFRVMSGQQPEDDSQVKLVAMMLAQQHELNKLVLSHVLGGKGKNR